MKRFTFFVVFTFMIVPKSFAQSIPANSPNSVIEKAEQGDIESQYKLGIYYYCEKNYRDAFLWFLKAAEQDHAAAQSYLGICYYNGEGVQQDNGQAVYWLRKGAEKDYPVALAHLGLCYYNGEGVPQDYNKAINLYKKAAEYGKQALDRR